MEYISRFNGNSTIIVKLFYVSVGQRKLGNRLPGTQIFSGTKRATNRTSKKNCNVKCEFEIAMKIHDFL